MRSENLALRLLSRPICQLCNYRLSRLAQRRALVTSTLNPLIVQRQETRQACFLPRTTTQCLTSGRATQQLKSRKESSPPWLGRTVSLKTKLAEVKFQIERIKTSSTVESDAVTVEALEALQLIARQAIAIRTGRPLPPRIDVRESSAGAILTIGREENLEHVATDVSTTLQRNDLPTPSYLSRLAEELVKHPNVFISPNVLNAYISLQRLLARPRTIPEVLYLYANKPVPELGSSPPKYMQVSPNAPKQAVPATLAKEALAAAIEAKDLPLALDVVEHTFCTKAWKRRRLLAKLGVPSVIAALTPLAIYQLAQELSIYSNFIDPSLFKLYSFMGFFSYVLCTGTLGFVALTTANDHFVRVVWRPGTPLLDRYVREDERAALDTIAQAWGFKEVWKRGDEEGEEWEGLREWIVLRGMILDKPDLLEGMNP